MKSLQDKLKGTRLILECYGRERIWMNSACDRGVSVPLAVPYAALELRRRGHSPQMIDDVIFGNPNRFLSQNPRFRTAQ